MKIKWERITRGKRSVMWGWPSGITSIHWGIVGGKRLFKVERFQGGGVLLKFAFDTGVLLKTISEAKEKAQEELDKWLLNEDNK